MVKCPECAAVLDVEEDEVEEAEILSCPECEVELEVVGLNPVQLNAISGDEDLDDDEEEDEKEDADDDDDDEEDDEEEEDEKDE